jgi:hypothetical protein
VLWFLPPTTDALMNMVKVKKELKNADEIDGLIGGGVNVSTYTIM